MVNNDIITYIKSIPYFPPGSCAWGHAALGFGIGFMEPWAQLIGTAAFIAYEVLRDKPSNEKIGGIAEYATGWMATQVITGGVTK